uniref:SUEL-type lectin domain-containing protein n=1 Tax=Periophthalmus magnuspinnatus TaxID=409849 RepID=A0A3B4BD10_9GOBI
MYSASAVVSLSQSTEEIDYVVDTDRGVIAVQAALYGRQDRETCSYGWIMDHPSDTNCFQEGTKEVLQKRCDGRSTCEVPLYVFHWSDPCYGYNYTTILLICSLFYRSIGLI